MKQPTLSLTFPVEAAPPRNPDLEMDLDYIVTECRRAGPAFTESLADRLEHERNEKAIQRLDAFCRRMSPRLNERLLKQLEARIGPSLDPA